MTGTMDQAGEAGEASEAGGASSLPEAYYLPGPDGVYQPTIATESPWATDAQHGGPPTALLAHVMRARLPAEGMRVARITNEFLGSIPRAPLTVRTEVIRDGRRIRLVEASLLADAKPVTIARAWQIATSGSPGPDGGSGPDGASLNGGAGAGAGGLAPAPALPPAMPQEYFSGFRHWGYGESIEWRWVRGSYASAGEAVVWARPRIPLVAGQPMDPLERALVIADSANGVSSALSPREWLFIPPSITVTLHRHPVGDWVYLAAASTLAPDGVGSTLGTLGDADGPIGSVAQPLLVARRT